MCDTTKNNIMDILGIKMIHYTGVHTHNVENTFMLVGVKEATKKGITGNKVTPFVLDVIRRQTNNKSIKTDPKLLE